jgi:tyrosyl-tRNA synthetase
VTRGSEGLRGEPDSKPTSALWEELEWRGIVHQATDPELGRLLAAERFTAYTGFDATADSLHAGHLIPILGLRRLQRAGHRPIALVGGGTTLIGDPSGRDTERPLLSTDEIDANVAAIGAQLSRFLDFEPGPAQAQLLDNAAWLRDLRLTDFLRDIGKHFSVNVMTAKESVRARLEHGLSYTEFSYMLLQAYDFLRLFEDHACRLQLGGSDQWGNITAGIELIRRKGAGQAYGLTWPLLTRADGSKFGKSEGDNVWLDARRTSSYRFYQYWLNTPDADLDRYLRLFTDLGREEIAAVVADPRAAQRRLAFEITACVHGSGEAERARDASAVLFDGRDPGRLDQGLLLEVFEEAPSSGVSRSELDPGAELVALLARTGLVKSKSEARNAIEAGGVYLNGVRETDTTRRVGTGDLLHGRYLVLRRGKKQYHLLRFE